MQPQPIEIQLALIRRDIEEIHEALFGAPGQDKRGLVQRVEELTQVANRGQWALRVVLWLGGTFVALATAAAQLRSVWVNLWGHH